MIVGKSGPKWCTTRSLTALHVNRCFWGKNVSAWNRPVGKIVTSLIPRLSCPCTRIWEWGWLWLVILTMYVPSCFGLTFVVWLARTRKIACSFACCWFSWFKKWSSSGPLCFYLVASIWNQFWTAGWLDSLFLAEDVVDSQLLSSSAFPSTRITTLCFSLGVWWDTLLV